MHCLASRGLRPGSSKTVQGASYFVVFKPFGTAIRCLSARVERHSPATHTMPYSMTQAAGSFASLQNDILCFDQSIPIQRAESPPRSWYTHPSLPEFERQSVFLRNWTAVDVLRIDKPGEFQTGTIAGQPYLITCQEADSQRSPRRSKAASNKEGVPHTDGNSVFSKDGKLVYKAFYNLCTHAGSCLVTKPGIDGERSGFARKNSKCSSASAEPSLPGSDILVGNTTSSARQIGCPYHGWRFNLDGRLAVTTDMKGIENFKNNKFNLKPIKLSIRGPVIFLNFDKGMPEDTQAPSGCSEYDKFEDVLQQHEYEYDFSDLELVHSREYVLDCNWKVFAENYGDGCYHCSYAHPVLAANINEDAYSTKLLSPKISAQIAPPSDSGTTERFGRKSAVYAFVYPNMMYNRYGPWLDTNLVKPLDDNRCVVQIDWFLAKDYLSGDERREFVENSLKSSEVVQQEDIFLCENVQQGMRSNGFERGRYVPARQQACFHFHQKLVQDYRHELGIQSV